MTKTLKLRSKMKVVPMNDVTHTEITHTHFDDLPEPTIQLWIAQAEQVIGRLGWTYEPYNYPELIYCTALFMYNTERLRKSERTYPYYAVHCMEDDSRFETPSYSIALGHFKRMQKDDKRVAVFQWLNRVQQERIYASADYPFSRDYGPQ